MRRFRFVRLLAVILSVLLLTSCTEYNLFQPQQDWDAFTEDFFISSLSSDALTLHYYVQDPEAFGITDVEDTFGTLTTDADDPSSYTWATDAISELGRYPDGDLDESQLLDKKTFLWYLQTEQMAEAEDFAYYPELAAPMYGIHANLIMNLANYAFNEESDIDHYLNLLQDVPRYMQELTDYEKEKAARGFGMPDSLIDEVVEECGDYLEGDLSDHVLVTTFDERLEGMTLSKDAEAYKEANRTAVAESILPAYEQFRSEMQTLKGQCKGTGSIFSCPKGKTYYEYLARQATGSDRSILEMKTLLNRYMNEQYAELYQIIQEEPDILDQMENVEYGASDPVDILEMISERMRGTLVPDIGDATYTVKYVPKSLEDSLNPAFCFIPQIDHPESAIYINQSPEYAHMDFFITVAHEGYPGHMYQQTYYNQTNPAHFRHILDFAGYAEGWAVYISYQALDLSDIQSDALKRLLVLDNAIGYEMQGLADIGVNYEGWTVEDLAAFFDGYGMDEETIRDVYDQLISSPATYLSYSEACLEFMELKDYAQQKMGSAYSNEAFHRIILDAGPTCFSILKDQIDANAKS